MPNITARTIKTAQSTSAAYFIRDSNLKGFALRVFPSGTIKYIAEVWYNGKSHRKTLGSYPVLGLTDARQKALSFIQGVHSGHNNEKAVSLRITLESLSIDMSGVIA